MKANDNAIGQFYVEVKAADKYFKVDCEITPLTDWPRPSETISDFGPGTYLVGRDIAAGTYRGQAGTDVMESYYWARLSGVSGDMGDVLANDNATGSFFVAVNAADYALHTGCALKKTE